MYFVNMKVWLKSLLLVITLSVYIALGSYAFILMEKDHHLRGQRELRARVRSFIANHSECGVDAMVTRELFRDIEAVWGYRRNLLANPDSPVWDLWTIQNAYVFCYTVVTTMGE